MRDKISFRRKLFMGISIKLFLVCTLSAENCIIQWVQPQSVEKMYGEDEISECSLFTGGFINFGYWGQLSNNEHISIAERLESEKNLYRLVFKKMKIDNQDKVLEIGCGLGLGSSLLLNEFFPKQVIALDASQTHINKATTLNKESIDKKKLYFHVGRAENLPFQSNFFEKIFSIEAAQHFDSINAFIKESYRVLKPNGRLAITTFFATTKESPKIAASMLKTVEDNVDHLVPISDLVQMLASAGFRNIHVKSIGKSVWPQFDKWIAQTEFKDTWDKNWFQAYKQNLIDYYLVTAEK